MRHAFAFLAFVALAGCEETNTYVEPPPPKVSVAQPLVEDIIDYLEMTGSTVPSARVDVRARVSGELESMHFSPGTDVEAGDLLFVIDPREYEAQREAARAELAAAQAEVRRAEIEYRRAKNLYKKKAGSEADVVRWQGALDVARIEPGRRPANDDVKAGPGRHHPGSDTVAIHPQRQHALVPADIGHIENFAVDLGLTLGQHDLYLFSFASETLDKGVES